MAQTEPWTVAGTPAGTWVSSRNVTYVKVWRPLQLDVNADILYV